MNADVQTTAARAPSTGLRGRNYARKYWPFVVPAGVVVHMRKRLASP